MCLLPVEEGPCGPHVVNDALRVHQCVPEVAAVRVRHGWDVKHVGFVRVVSPVVAAAIAAEAIAAAADVRHGWDVKHVGFVRVVSPAVAAAAAALTQTSLHC
jgi:hypothetical protein